MARKTTCSTPGCDNPKSKHNGYCRPCDNERQRLNRHRWPSDKTVKNIQYIARYKARNAKRDGILVEQPCVNCGDLPCDMHHEDYSKPLEITWLCKKCHREHHENEKKQAKSA